MPNRHNVDEAYRYAYNGMEQDNEVSGNGNSYTTEFRQYDPRLGRWKSLDPLMSSFPHMSPYIGFDNNPIYFTDPYGLESGKGGVDIGDGNNIKSDAAAEGTGLISLGGSRWVTPERLQIMINDSDSRLAVAQSSYAKQQTLKTELSGAEQDLSRMEGEKAEIEDDIREIEEAVAILDHNLHYRDGAPAKGGFASTVSSYAELEDYYTGFTLEERMENLKRNRENPQIHRTGDIRYNNGFVGFSDIIVVPVQAGLEDGFVELGMDRSSASTLSNGLVIAGSLWAGGVRPSTIKSPFGARGGYGPFGTDGLIVKNTKFDIMHRSSTPGDVTIFSAKGLKPGGTRIRWDYGRVHGSEKSRLHSTIRITIFGKKFGSTAQRTWYPPYRKL